MQTFSVVRPASILNNSVKIIFIVAGSLLFNALFWKEKIALNAVVFFVYIIAGITHIYPGVFSNAKVRWLTIATMFSLSMVIIHNTTLSKISFSVSVMLLAAYSQYFHNSMLYAGASILQSFAFFLPTFAKASMQLFFVKKIKFGLGKKARLAILPIFITIIFLIFYLLANKIFADVVDRISLKINWLLDNIFTWAQPQRVVFIFIGLFISGGLLVRYIKAPIEKSELEKTDILLRVKNKKNGNSITDDIWQFLLGKLATGSMAIKNEYKAGLLCLLLLNGLLLIVNFTDIIYVWFGYNYKPGINWANFVHEGAELLVLSILLAMGLVLFFFRGNLNFFSKNKWLKILAYTWIAQNAVLAISVCIRNMYYIQHMGLAYKRVGLFVYILLVLIGLFTIVLKIKNRKTTYYLWRVNALAAFLVLVISSCIDWDVAIATYNISKKDVIQSDISFLLRMNDHVLPLLQQNKTWICAQSDTDEEYGRSIYTSIKCELIDIRINAFIESEKKYSWLSWNLSDKKTLQELQASIQK